MKKKLIKIGARGSNLSVIQAKMVIKSLQKAGFGSQYKFEIIKIRTSGDNRIDGLMKNENVKELFTKEIRSSLRNREIDIAVHSVKDLECHNLDDIELISILKRDDPRDGFFSNKYKNIFSIPKATKIGTSSTRREFYLKKWRKDIEIVKIRGNIDTRAKKMKEMNLDGIILSYCGEKRLKKRLSKFSSKIPYEIMIPAIGQGAIGIEILKNANPDLKKALLRINHTKSYREIQSERKFGRDNNLDCKTTIGYCSRKV